ncbi:hypothetical protein CsSME_00013671 [Camellia sinensis var. sinensis]
MSTTKLQARVSVMGWICAAFNLAVLASRLSIMRRVIRTKSVEHMPFTLSFSLTLHATMWFFYGFFTKDFYIAASQSKLTNIIQINKFSYTFFFTN